MTTMTASRPATQKQFDFIKKLVAMGDMQVGYEYLGAAATHLPTDAKRLPLDQVGKLGVATNHCLLCGRRLDDPESVDRGIGPVCAKNY